MERWLCGRGGRRQLPYITITAQRHGAAGAPYGLEPFESPLAWSMARPQRLAFVVPQSSRLESSLWFSVTFALVVLQKTTYSSTDTTDSRQNLGSILQAQIRYAVRMNQTSHSFTVILQIERPPYDLLEATMTRAAV